MGRLSDIMFLRGSEFNIHFDDLESVKGSEFTIHLNDLVCERVKVKDLPNDNLAKGQSSRFAPMTQSGKGSKFKPRSNDSVSVKRSKFQT